MNYLEARSLLKEIEENNDVMSIKYKDVPVWLFLRVYLIAYFYSDQPSSSRKVSKANILTILSNLFFYTPLCFFKKNLIWIYDGIITRKNIQNKYVHHATGAINNICCKSLLLESPEKSKRHYNKRDIEESRVISNSWSIMIARGLSYFIKIKDLKNEQVLKDILEKYKIDFDYTYYIKFLYSQKLTVDFLLNITYHPKMVFMINAYNQMGYVWSFHNHGIPVIEMQHGVLNSIHHAYSSPFYSNVLYPDEICVYGENEDNYLKYKQPKYADKVTITGLYMLECADNVFNKDIFEECRNHYEVIMVVAGETGREKSLSMFIDDIAHERKNMLFVYIPRRQSEDITFSSTNCICVYGKNIYEYLKWCDVHCTIMSTTCLEAHYFKKPVIFYDEDGGSNAYYGKVLNKNEGAFYASNKSEFLYALDMFNKREYQFKELFAHDHTQRLSEVINRYLNHV